MSMTFNQFQKELRNRNIDPQVAYFMSVLYEQHMEVLKQVDQMATIINSLADTVGNVVELHSVTKERVEMMNKRLGGDYDGVTVTTEPGKGN